MKDLKIRVNSEAESKEAQELFFELGYTWSGDSKDIFDFDMPEYIVNWNNGYITVGDDFDKNRQEITLPELRDLVVLKRNSIDDATHEDKNDPEFKYRLIDNNWYVITEGNPVWRKDSIDLNEAPLFIKPIEKPMKEYLRKNSNGTYSYIGTVRPEHVSDFMIELPEGSNIVTCENRKGNLVYFHWKSLDSDEFFLKDGKIWSNNFNETLSDFVKKNEGDVKIIWSRYTHPEELPFIDDEPPQSLNDQYAEIEKVRQSAWQKQEGGSHCKNLKIQPMQYALENKLDYAQANVVKYVTRHKEKNGKEDLLKAIHNIELMIEFYYGDEK